MTQDPSQQSPDEKASMQNTTKTSDFAIMGNGNREERNSSEKRMDKLRR